MISLQIWLTFQERPVTVGYGPILIFLSDLVVQMNKLYAYGISLQAYTHVCLVFFLFSGSYDFIGMMQINEFVKRARSAKMHAYIISHLKKEMPAMMGKAKAQQRLIDNLEEEFRKVSSFASFSLASLIS